MFSYQAIKSLLSVETAASAWHRTGLSHKPPPQCSCVSVCVLHTNTFPRYIFVWWLAQRFACVLDGLIISCPAEGPQRSASLWPLWVKKPTGTKRERKCCKLFLNVFDVCVFSAVSQILNYTTKKKKKKGLSLQPLYRDDVTGNPKGTVSFSACYILDLWDPVLVTLLVSLLNL